MFDDIEHHFMWVHVRDFPDGLPLEANARRPKDKLNRDIDKDVRASLRDEEPNTPGTFHLKNLGETIVAHAVRMIEKGVYEVEVDELTEGILNGGHTARIIADLRAEKPDNYVLVHIETGIPREIIPECSGGLNTTIQVQQKSLLDLKGSFEWLQKALSDEPYRERIVFKEGDDGDIDVREIIALLYCLNPKLDGRQPVAAYSQKEKCLDYYAENPEQFERLTPILKDALILYDTIRAEARDRYNAATQGRGGGLFLMEKKKSGDFDFPFVEKKGPHRLSAAAAMPIFAAFRAMLTTGNGKPRWKGGFDKVLELWQEVGGDLVREINDFGANVGYKPNAIGKDQNVWEAASKSVRLAQFEKGAN
jgi:AIPR protein